jgi:hypothetical protein
MRGGSWNNNARRCRSAYRDNRHPDKRDDNQGFRLARAQRPPESSFVTRPASCPSIMSAAKSKGTRRPSSPGWMALAKSLRATRLNHE